MKWFFWLSKCVLVGLAIAGATLVALSAGNIGRDKEDVSQTLQCILPPLPLVQINDVDSVVYDRDVLIVFKNNERIYIKLPYPGMCAVVTHPKNTQVVVPQPPQKEIEMIGDFT